MTKYYRKVIQIKAEHSPNVILGLAEKRAGKRPSNKMIVPGVLSWYDYQKRRSTWDLIRQCIGLDAEFYEGAELKMFPGLWLNRAATLARRLHLENRSRRAKALGIDPGEGQEDSSFAVIDELGLIEMVSAKTPDTTAIPTICLDLMRRYKLQPEQVCLDRGGGGKQHADYLRRIGYKVRTVAFGEPILVPIKYGETQVKERIVNREERYSFKNRRAEMYGNLRVLLDPVNKGFAIPAQYTTLREELTAFPLSYDEEGRLFLPPKNKKDPNSKTKTLIEIIGHSPNEADALVVAVHCMLTKPLMARAGVG